MLCEECYTRLKRRHRLFPYDPGEEDDYDEDI